MLEPIQAQCLASLPGISHGFFTRNGGVSDSLYASLNCGPGSSDVSTAWVARSRRPFHPFRPCRPCRGTGLLVLVGDLADQRLGGELVAIEPQVFTLYQIHSATALAVEGQVHANGRPKADALVTRTPGLAIGSLTADCAPVLFADPEARVVGAAHAGWRGAMAGILEAAITEMERLGGRRERIFAAIGPSISQAAYEVGPEFKAALIEGNLGNARFFDQSEPNARPHFDLLMSRSCADWPMP